MTLTEMLEYVGEYLDDRTDLISGEPDELWSPGFIARQLNRAEKIHARRAWSIIDIGHAQAGRITLQTGVTVYSVHASVLRVLDATLAGDTGFLSRVTDQALRRARVYDDGWWPDLDSAAAPGRTLAFATDTATRRLRVYPPPRVDENGLVITLRVVRLPVTLLSVESPGASPEISADYHEDLCDYACGKCLLQPTVDGQAKADGRALIADFDAAVKEARRDRQRAGMDDARWAFNSTTAEL